MRQPSHYRNSSRFSPKVGQQLDEAGAIHRRGAESTEATQRINVSPFSAPLRCTLCYTLQSNDQIEHLKPQISNLPRRLHGQRKIDNWTSARGCTRPVI